MASKKLSQSAVFSRLVSNKSLIEKMNTIASSNRINILSVNDDLSNEFNTINRRINYSTKGAILTAIQKGQIVLFDEKTLNIPVYIPAVPGLAINGDLKMFINLNRYRNGKEAEIYPKTLFGLMQNALIFMNTMKNWDSYSNNFELMRNCSISYSRMMTKILDKVFALDLDPFNSDFMSFVFSKFFLVNVAGRKNNETNDDVALKACFNKSSSNLIFELEKELPSTIYDDIFKLFDGLKLVKGFGKINIRSFTEQFVRMYGEGSLLALDYLPSFLQVITSSVIGSNLVKDYFIENVSGTFNIKAYNQICSIIQ